MRGFRGWDKEPLGIESDSSIADRLGCGHATVQRARVARGIPRFSQRGRELLDVRWSAQPLGEASDGEIAATVGCSKEAVRQARIRRGIETPWVEHSLEWWRSQPLGQMRDSELAPQLGVTRSAIWLARRKLGIGRFMPEPSLRRAHPWRTLPKRHEHVWMERPYADGRMLRVCRWCGFVADVGKWEWGPEYAAVVSGRTGDVSDGPVSVPTDWLLWAIRRQLERAERLAR